MKKKKQTENQPQKQKKSPNKLSSLSFSPFPSIITESETDQLNSD